MQRLLVLLAAAALLAAAGGSDGGPAKVIGGKGANTPTIPALFSQVYSAEFKGGERACVIALGNGRTYLGLYVYDAHGNCIAWDDEGRPRSRPGQTSTVDDLAVDWFPAASGW